MTCLQSNN